MFKDGFLLYFFVIVIPLRVLGNFTAQEQNAPLSDALWGTILRGCKRPTLSCIQNNVYSYLYDSFDYPKDVDFGFLTLTKNAVEYVEPKVEIVQAASNETNLESDARAMEDFPGVLRERMVKFLMTHDVELQLPDVFFDGGVFRISPRSFDGDGTLVKLDILRGDVKNPNGEGRIFLKKLKEFIGEKLLSALLAILLVIALLSVKFLFLLPMAVGAAAAKKLLLKLVLFVFPFLAHIFKLCPYVPHGTKYHHHQHFIKHLHHVDPHGPHHHGSLEVIAPHAGGPPSLHHHLDHKIKDGHHHYNPHEDDLHFYGDGPSYTHEFITHRKEDKQQAEEDSNKGWFSWGQGQTTAKPQSPADKKGPLTPTEIERMIVKAEKEAMLKARLQQEQIRVQAENLRLQEQIRKAMKLQEKLKLQSMLVTNNIKLPAATIPVATIAAANVPAPSLPVAQPNALLGTNQPVAQPSVFLQTPPIKPLPLTQPAIPTLPQHDAFYSPILEKIDKILVGLGFVEEPCRERLICSMYKNPTKFSPHSNLLSAELSRDSNELQKPTSTNAAVIRFYKYVQAARDGQDQRDCIRLYPSCLVNTEQ